MLGLRALVFAIALLTPALAFRLGGLALWTSYAAGMTIAAALAAFALWRDGLLRRVLLPQGLDISAGFLGAAALFAASYFAWRYLLAPHGLAHGMLARCVLDGPRFARPDARGLVAVMELARRDVCRGYGVSLGLLGPARGAMLLFIAVLEELAWRGGVQQALSERLGSTRGWLAASALYAIAQATSGNGALALLALASGLLWGGLYRYRGRLAPALMSHATLSYFLFHARPLADFS